MSEPRLTFLLGSVTLLSWKSLQKRYSSPHSRNLKGVYEVWPLTYTFSFLKEIANKMDDCPQVKSKRCMQKSKLNRSILNCINFKQRVSNSFIHRTLRLPWTASPVLEFPEIASSRCKNCCFSSLRISLYV